MTKWPTKREYPRILSQGFELLKTDEFHSKIPKFDKDCLAVFGIIHLLANEQGEVKRKYLYDACSKNGISKKAAISSIKELADTSHILNENKVTFQIVGDYWNYLFCPSNGKEFLVIKEIKRLGRNRFSRRDLTIERRETFFG